MIQMFCFKNVINEQNCFNLWSQWPWRIWPLPKFGILCGMPWYEEEVIILKWIHLNKDITSISSRQHPLFWMWLQDVSFYQLKRYRILMYYCWKEKMGLYERTMCVIVCCVICLMWMTTLIHPQWLFLLTLSVCCVNNL
jgi:hypothetical protein